MAAPTLGSFCIMIWQAVDGKEKGDVVPYTRRKHRKAEHCGRAFRHRVIFIYLGELPRAKSLPKSAQCLRAGSPEVAKDCEIAGVVL